MGAGPAFHTSGGAKLSALSSDEVADLLRGLGTLYEEAAELCRGMGVDGSLLAETVGDESALDSLLDDLNVTKATMRKNLRSKLIGMVTAAQDGEGQMGPKREFKLFLSHTKVDGEAQTLQIMEDLQKLGVEEKQIFFDRNHLDDLTLLGDEYVKDSDNLVVCLTNGILGRPWCLYEFMAAARHGITLIPVAIQDPTPFEAPADVEKYCREQALTLHKDHVAFFHQRGILMKELGYVLLRLLRDLIRTPYDSTADEELRKQNLQFVLRKMNKGTAMDTDPSSFPVPVTEREAVMAAEWRVAQGQMNVEQDQLNFLKDPNRTCGRMLIANKWRTSLEELVMSEEDKRNTLIVELSKVEHTAIGLAEAQGMSNESLSHLAAARLYLLLHSLISKEDAARMKEEDYRQAMIRFLLSPKMELDSEENLQRRPLAELLDISP